MNSPLFFISLIISVSLIHAAQDLSEPLLATPFAIPVSGPVADNLPVATSIELPKDERSRAFQFIGAACENDYAAAAVLMSQGGFNPRACQVSISGNLGDILRYMKDIDPRIIAYTGNAEYKKVSLLSCNIAADVKPVKPLLREASHQFKNTRPVIVYKDGRRVKAVKP